MAAKKTATKFELKLLPPPRGKFTKERAERWLGSAMGMYQDVTAQALIEMGSCRRGCSLWWAVDSFNEDLAEMARACAEVMAGRPVRFVRREDQEGELPRLALELIVHVLKDGYDDLSRMHCILEELALEAIERAALRDEQNAKTSQEVRFAMLDKVTAERDEARADFRRLDDWTDSLLDRLKASGADGLKPGYKDAGLTVRDWMLDEPEAGHADA